MRRRDFITLLGGAAAARPLAARAQQGGLPTVAYLSPSPPDGQLLAFRQGLKEGGGYLDGENVVIDYRWGDNEPDRLPALAADLVRRRVNVIAVLSAPAALVVARATSTIPTVFMVPDDPVRLGLVASLARPGGNRTGVNFFAAEVASKRLELLRTLVLRSHQRIPKSS
jgi:putative ABC transport system substrate-binding protein